MRVSLQSVFFCLFIDSQQKGRSNKKNKKKKRIKTLNKEITLAQAGQQMFGGYYKVGGAAKNKAWGNGECKLKLE